MIRNVHLVLAWLVIGMLLSMAALIAHAGAAGDTAYNHTNATNSSSGGYNSSEASGNISANTTSYGGNQTNGTGTYGAQLSIGTPPEGFALNGTGMEWRGSLDVRGERFRISLGGTAFRSMDIRLHSRIKQLNITVSNSSVPFSQAPETAPGDVYQYIQINQSAASLLGTAANADQFISNVTYNFSVPRSWIIGNGGNPGNVTLFKYNSGKWLPLPTSLYGSNITSFYFSGVSDSLSSYAVSYLAGNTQSSSTTNVVLTLPPGFTSYVFACGTGGYSIPAESFTVAKSAYYSSCGGNCASTGYQSTNVGWCQQSTSWYEITSGIGFNALISRSAQYSAANVSGGSKTTLSYTVGASNSFVAIVGACGWEDCSLGALPSGCTKTTSLLTSGQDSSVSAVCTQNPGTYTLTMTPSASPGIGVLAAYVFAPYGVVLDINPATGNIITNNGIRYPNGATMTVIGTNPITAAAPATGTYSFTGWTVSNPSNIVIGNALSTSTVATIEGNGIITADFNGITAFSESGLPPSTTWNVVYDSSLESSTSNTLTFDTVPGTYPFSIANQIVGGSTYVPFPQSGSAVAGNSVSVAFSKAGTLSLVMQSNSVAYDQGDTITATAPSGSDTVQILVGKGTSPGSVVATGTGSVSCDAISTCNPPSDAPMPAGTYNVVAYDSTVSQYTSDNALTVVQAYPSLSLTVPQSYQYDGNGGVVDYSITTYNSQLTGSLYVNNVLTATTSSSSAYTTSSAPGTYAELFDTLGNANYTSASLTGNFQITAAAYSVPFSFGSNSLPLGGLLSVSLPGAYSGHYCNAGAFTTFSTSPKPLTWFGDANATDASSPPPAASVGHQNTNVCSANTVGASGNAGESIAGIGINQTNYQLYTSAGNSVTSQTLNYNVASSNSFVLLLIASGGQEFSSTSIPSGCTRQEYLLADYAGNPGAATEIATCTNTASGSYTASATPKSAGAVALAAYVFQPRYVTLDDTPSSATINTNESVYSNGQVMRVIGTGNIQALAPPSGNYVFSRWTTSNSANLTVFNSIDAVTNLNVNGNGIVTADWNGITSFAETGLPGGNAWNVIYNGQTLSSTQNTIQFQDTPGTYSYSIPDQMVGAVNYLVSPASGAAIAGNTVQVTFTPATCGIDVSDNNIAFGTVYPSTSLPTDNSVAVTDVGNVNSILFVYGNNWASGPLNFGVSNTVYSKTSGTPWGSATPLGTLPANTGILLPAGSGNDIYFGLGVPTGQSPSPSYTQTITLETSC